MTLSKRITIDCELSDDYVLADLIKILELALGYMADNVVITSTDAPTDPTPVGGPVTLNYLWTEAALLLSEQNENVEYDRALTELCCIASGRSTDAKDEVLNDLRNRRDRLHGNH